MYQDLGEVRVPSCHHQVGTGLWVHSTASWGGEAPLYVGQKWASSSYKASAGHSSVEQPGVRCYFLWAFHWHQGGMASWPVGRALTLLPPGLLCRHPCRRGACVTTGCWRSRPLTWSLTLQGTGGRPPYGPGRTKPWLLLAAPLPAHRGVGS